MIPLVCRPVRNVPYAFYRLSSAIFPFESAAAHLLDQIESKDCESVSDSYLRAAEGCREYDGKVMSPLSRARMAAALGGDSCAGCGASERSRQLMPCHHVLCGACVRLARDDGDDVCPVCRAEIYDDVPMLK